jgi:hypothetical protein
VKLLLALTPVRNTMAADDTKKATFPVVAELWSIFESTLQLQAKKLVEDIAAHQRADPKILWGRVRSQIRIGLLDIEIPETEALCLHPSSSTEGAMYQRCRAPCLLGFDACPQHIHTPNTMGSRDEEVVDRVIDFKHQAYFVDSQKIARDKNGKPVGYVEEDGVLYLFEKVTASAS